MFSFSFHAKLQRLERRPGASLYRSSLYWYGIYLLIPDAEWLPYMMNHLEIGYVRQRKRWPAAALLRENQIYVACQTNDDLPYILDHLGDDHLVLGTDYGDNDTSSELNAMRKLKVDGKISGTSIDKILGSNAQALYSL